MAQAFVASSKVIQFQNSENRNMIGRGSADVNYSGLAAVNTTFLITIEHKDERARMTLEQMRIDELDAVIPELNNELQFQKFREQVAGPMHRDWLSPDCSRGRLLEFRPNRETRRLQLPEALREVVRALSNHPSFLQAMIYEGLHMANRSRCS